MSLKSHIYKSWVKSRDATFLSLLEFNPEAVAIDLGCGNGSFTLEVKRKVGCNEIDGIDVYDEVIKEAKRIGVKVKKVNLNDYLPFHSSSFDVVISNQVIEHLFYPVKFMSEIYRILKPNGYAVISTENLASWDNVIALVLGFTPFSMEFDGGLLKVGNPLSPHEKKIIEGYPPHVRIFSYRGLIELARFVGFNIERVMGNGHILGKMGELVNKKNARFITFKVRK